jgi:hypothetical protein
MAISLHGFAMLLPCCVFATILSCYCHVLAMDKAWQDHVTMQGRGNNNGNGNNKGNGMSMHVQGVPGLAILLLF